VVFTLLLEPATYADQWADNCTSFDSLAAAGELAQDDRPSF
jgi:hypothetical protein